MFKGVAEWLKRKDNLQTVQELTSSEILHRVNSLICTPDTEIEITFGHSRLGVENKFFPSKISFLPTYTTFIS